MRRLRIVIGRSPRALPAIAVVSLLPALGSCGSRSGLLTAEDAGAGGGAGTGGTSAGGVGGSGGTGGLIITGGTSGFGGSGGSGGTGGNAWCSPYSQLETHTVDIPPPGVPADPGQLCAVSTEPVESNAAARVTLTKYSPSLSVAQGFIALPPGIHAAVAVVPPKITVKSANPPQLADMLVSDVAFIAGGFSFHASWPSAPALQPNGWVMLQIEVELEIACDPAGTDLRTIRSTTEIHLCIGDTDLEWVSSGDECTVCKTIAEMAPPPMPPDQQPDELPLPKAFRLRVVELARAGNTALLFAENDAGAGAEYQWHATGGRLEPIEPDLVLWTADEGEDALLAQVALKHAEGVAVASFDWVAP